MTNEKIIDEKELLSEKVKEINVETKKERLIEDYFNILFKILPSYLDYYESDLGMYLTNKFVRKFPIYIVIRAFIISGMIISIILFNFLELAILTIISSIVFYLLIFLYFIFEKIIKKKYDLTFYFFQVRNKKLKLFKDLLYLFSNNTYLAEEYNSSSFEFDSIKNRLNKLKLRVENDIKITRSYSYYLINFGLPVLLTILLAPLVNLVFTILPEIYANIDQVDVNLIIDFILNLIPSGFLLVIWFRAIKNRIESIKLKEKSIYYICEAAIFGILELIRQKIKSLEFPEDMKILNDLQNSFDLIKINSSGMQ